MSSNNPTPVATTATTAARPRPRPDYHIGALAKGLRVLALFDEQRPSWSVTAISTTTGLPMPTVYRLVMTLVSEGYLDQLPDGDYRPSVRSLTLGTAALRSLDLVGIAQPLLQRLGNDTRETVNLAVLVDDQVLYLIRLRNSNLVTANIQVGSRLPAASTSIGKLLLSNLDDRQVRALFGPGPIRAGSGPNAVTSVAALRRELGVIRSQGWAIQDEELAYGLRSLAVPVIDETGALVAGVNVAVQAREWSLQRMLADLLPPLQSTCRKVSALMGHHDVH